MSGKIITLKFSKDNNFCPIAKKYGNTDKTVDIARETLWLINCAEVGIEKTYKEGSPRRLEMEALCADLRKQLRKQITKRTAEEIHLYHEPLILG